MESEREREREIEKKQRLRKKQGIITVRDMGGERYKEKA